MAKFIYFLIINTYLDEIGTFDSEEIDVSLLTGKIRTINTQLSINDDVNKELIQYNAGELFFFINKKKNLKAIILRIEHGRVWTINIKRR